MLVKKITFPSPTELENIKDIKDDNIDVFVELEDGSNYTVVVGTPKNLESLMDKEKSDFFGPGCPFIIVKKLTKEIIEEAIKEHAKDNAYWLKFYHLAGEVDIDTVNKLLDRINERDKLFDKVFEEGNSSEIDTFFERHKLID